MCRHCLLSVRPDRARFVAEAGAYTLNYAGCFACSRENADAMVKQPIKVTARNAEEEDDDGEYEETVTYSHSCSVCDHVIAEHYYSFRVTKKEVELAVQVDPSSSSSAPASGDASAAGQSAMVVTHDYLMECVLCGKGADEQVHHHHHHHHRHHAGSSPAALPPVAGPPISLAAIQLQNVPPPTTTTMDAKEEEEWA